MKDYLTFRRMITPVFIQVIFWFIVLVISSLVSRSSQTDARARGF
jgi:hypothetical protein